MKITRTVALLSTVMLSGLVLTGCGAASDPLPQGTAPGVEQPAEEPAAEVSTCDAAREAFLTGTVKEQTAALKALKADKTADATAREYAGYWLGRDKDSPELREMDQTLIVSACSL